MKVLVCGAGGQLGLDLLDAFDGHRVVGLSRGDLDVTDPVQVLTRLQDEAPDVVVNAAAWTDVDGCEDDPDRAHRTHAVGPWALARACARLDATLVTFSTDQVFGAGPARNGRAFAEWEPPAPCNVYGRSKAAGEQLVRDTLPDHQIIRTAWLAGARGQNFATAVLAQARDGARLAVVDDEVGSPTYTRDLAAAVPRLLALGFRGTLNLTNHGRCSRLTLARAVLGAAGLDVVVEPVRAADLVRAARRPGFSVLDPTLADTMGVGPLPDWREGVRRLVAELDGVAAGGPRRSDPGGAA